MTQIRPVGYILGWQVLLLGVLMGLPMLIDLYRQGRLDLDRFVSETISIDDVEAAFHKMEAGGVLRSVVVLP